MNFDDMLNEFKKNETQYLILDTLKTMKKIVSGEIPNEPFNVGFGQQPNKETKELCSGYWLNYRGLAGFFSKNGSVYTFETSYGGMKEYLPNKKDVETQAEQQQVLSDIYAILAKRYRDDINLFNKSNPLPSVSTEGIRTMEFRHGEDDAKTD